MIEASELSTSILARWLLLTLTIALRPSLTLVGLVALWALVLQQLGKQGIPLAAMMSVVGVVSTVVVYAAA